MRNRRMRVPVQGDLRKGTAAQGQCSPLPAVPRAPTRHYRNDHYGCIGMYRISISCYKNFRFDIGKQNW